VSAAWHRCDNAVNGARALNIAAVIPVQRHRGTDMTHRLFGVGTAVAGVLALTTAFALAQSPDERPQGRGRPPTSVGPGSQGPVRGPGRGLPALDLTEDQRTKIAELRKATHEQSAPLRDQLMAIRQTLHRDVLAVLTPEQREKMRTMERRGRGRGRGAN
jgi:Spy/CpxP family protein refolding chaperone